MIFPRDLTEKITHKYQDCSSIYSLIATIQNSSEDYYPLFLKAVVDPKWGGSSHGVYVGRLARIIEKDKKLNLNRLRKIHRIAGEWFPWCCFTFPSYRPLYTSRLLVKRTSEMFNLLLSTDHFLESLGNLQFQDFEYEKVCVYKEWLETGRIYQVDDLIELSEFANKYGMKDFANVISMYYRITHDNLEEVITLALEKNFNAVLKRTIEWINRHIENSHIILEEDINLLILINGPDKKIVEFLPMLKLFVKISIKVNPENYQNSYNILNEILGNLKVSSLDFANCVKLHDEELRDLLKLVPHLEKLILENCTKITNVGVCSIGDFCRSLKMLNLNYNYQITGNGISVAIVLCRHLKCLLLKGVTNVNDEVLSTIGEYLKELEELDISGQKISHFGIERLPPLKRISLSRTPVDDLAIAHLVRNSQYLESIHLKGCIKITHWGIEMLVKSNSNLRVLDLESCNLTNKSLKNIANYCNQLIYLNMSGNIQLKDDELINIMNSNTEMKYLYLEHCSNLTNQSLEYAEGLEKFILSDNSNITDDGVDYLLENAKKLKVFSLKNCPLVFSQPLC